MSEIVTFGQFQVEPEVTEHELLPEPAASWCHFYRSLGLLRFWFQPGCGRDPERWPGWKGCPPAEDLHT